MNKQYLICILLLAGTLPPLIASYTTIPFRPVGNLIVFQATVEGQTGNFILDSGVRNLVLNSTSFKESPKWFLKNANYQSINRKTETVQVFHTHFVFAELSIKSEASLIDLHPIEKNLRLPILALVGFKLFRDFELTIDYFSREIILYPVDKKGARLEPETLPTPTTTLAFRYQDHLPCITARLDGMELSMGIDTGAGINILSQRTLESIQSKIDSLGQKTMMGLHGAKTTVSSVPVGNLEVADLILPAMETIFLSMKALKSSGLFLDGLLGHPFLQHFRMAFNFRKKEIYLWIEEDLQQHSFVTGKN